MLQGRVHVFEDNIRILGGFLSAYELSQEPIFLEKARLVGDVLMTAFKNGRDLPCGVIDTTSPLLCVFPYGATDAFTAEVGTLALEFLALSYHTGDTKYAQRIDQINAYFESLGTALYRDRINIFNGGMSGTLHMGGGTDSMYEYLLKQWLWSSDMTVPLKLYRNSVKGIRDQLLTSAGPWTYLQDAGSSMNKWTHLQCFIGGTLILGGPQDASLGMALTDTCVQMYRSNPTGLACDEVYVTAGGDFTCKNMAWRNRPETVESVLYSWRYTHDPKWRAAAVDIMNAIERYSRVATGGYANVDRPDRLHPYKSDNQESFFLAETLKYLYLIFSNDSVLSFDKYVFNTEAHPLLRRKISTDGATAWGTNASAARAATPAATAGTRSTDSTDGMGDASNVSTPATSGLGMSTTSNGKTRRRVCWAAGKTGGLVRVCLFRGWATTLVRERLLFP